jgi:para-aminobenzoate synthetase component 1
VSDPLACFGDVVATGLRDVTTDLSALDGEGWWAAVVAYEGQPVVARFDDVRRARPPVGPWQGPAREAWTTSLDERAYVAAVEVVRERIAAGDVYQANVCRVLQARLPDPSRSDIPGSPPAARSQPAPYGGVVAARPRAPGAALGGRGARGHGLPGAVPRGGTTTS